MRTYAYPFASCIPPRPNRCCKHHKTSECPVLMIALCLQPKSAADIPSSSCMFPIVQVPLSFWLDRERIFRPACSVNLTGYTFIQILLCSCQVDSVTTIWKKEANIHLMKVLWYNIWVTLQQLSIASLDGVWVLLQYTLQQYVTICNSQEFIIHKTQLSSTVNSQCGIGLPNA